MTYQQQSYPQHFALEEFLLSSTAIQIGSTNFPSWEVVENLGKLAVTMEHIRARLGCVITITSGFRCPAVNTAVGGAANSAHLYGLACDFVAPLFGTPYEIVEVIKPHIVVLEIDQLIYEIDWVHLGLSSGEPRGQCFTINP